MNIQINCNENVSENDLRYIYYNLKDYIKLYEENKNNSLYLKYGCGGRHWEFETKGNFMMKPKITIRCNGKTMYFKVVNK